VFGRWAQLNCHICGKVRALPQAGYVSRGELAR
jgi:hypothetical protein